MSSYGVKIVEKQALTASYANFGSEIDCRKHAKIGILIKADVNNSTNVSLKGLAKMKNESTLFEIDGVSVKTLWTTGASDFNKYYEFEVGTIEYLQLQAIAGTVGATAGTLTIFINKV